MTETIVLIVLIGIGMYVVRAARGLVKDCTLVDENITALGRVIESGALRPDEAQKVRERLGQLILR